MAKKTIIKHNRHLTFKAFKRKNTKPKVEEIKIQPEQAVIEDTTIKKRTNKTTKTETNGESSTNVEENNE